MKETFMHVRFSLWGDAPRNSSAQVPVFAYYGDWQLTFPIDIFKVPLKNFNKGFRNEIILHQLHHFWRYFQTALLFQTQITLTMLNLRILSYQLF